MMTRRELAGAAALALQNEAKPVVLTFDDSCRSHLTVAAPLLKELGFNATFFQTHRWMDDLANFMQWDEVKKLHEMGFEIGNHSWTHMGFGTPRAAARLEAELSLIDREFARLGIPKATSFAWTGNAFGPEARAELERLGYRHARRGMQPERPYEGLQLGPGFDPAKHDRLLIPTTGDARPEWTLEHFDKVISQPGLPVLQFHGVPDPAHPWVHTPAEMFEKYMRRLKQRGFRGIALKDLSTARAVGSDPMHTVHYPMPKDGKLPRPFAEEHPLPRVTGRETRLAPFPGHEHPRIGFLEGAIAPLRGTKVMAFLPWDPDSYVVIDVPEAIFAGPKLLFLAHTHVPSIWDERNVTVADRDWHRDGTALESRWTFPDTLEFSMRLAPDDKNGIDMQLSVTNKSSETWTAMRSQVCVMLKRARGFEAQTVANKEFGKSVARVKAGGRAIAVEWENCQRTWGNPACPCMHSDPKLPDCAPGQTVQARGRLWFDS